MHRHRLGVKPVFLPLLPGADVQCLQGTQDPFPSHNDLVSLLCVERGSHLTDLSLKSQPVPQSSRTWLSVCAAMVPFQNLYKPHCPFNSDDLTTIYVLNESSCVYRPLFMLALHPATPTAPPPPQPKTTNPAYPLSTN